MYSTEAMRALTTVTDAELRRWKRRGYVSQQSGKWPLPCVLKIELMVRLVEAGFRDEPASRIASAFLATNNGTATLSLGHSLFLHLDRSQTYAESILECFR